MVQVITAAKIIGHILTCGPSALSLCPKAATVFCTTREEAMGPRAWQCHKQEEFLKTGLIDFLDLLLNASGTFGVCPPLFPLPLGRGS